MLTLYPLVVVFDIEQESSIKFGPFADEPLAPIVSVTIPTSSADMATVLSKRCCAFDGQ